MNPVCSQCQSMMERQRQSVGHTQANHMGKYKHFILCNTHTDYNLAQLIKIVKLSGHPLTFGMILTLLNG